MKHIFFLFLLLFIFSASLYSQVSINFDGSDPHNSTALHIKSDSLGVSIPNLNINNLDSSDPVNSPIVGLIGYNTNTSTGVGLVWWNGSRWVKLENVGINWKLTGNTGTSPGQNILGTLDDIDFTIGTNNIERMRVLKTGEVVVNHDTVFYSGDMFSAVATNDQWAVNGYAESGAGVYGKSTGDGYGVYGSADTLNAFGVRAKNNSGSGTGLLVAGNNLSSSYLVNGTGIASSGDDGIYAKGKHEYGTGVIAVGNDCDSAFTLIEGSGGSFSGHTGIYARVAEQYDGTGVIGIGYNVTSASTVTSGSGGAFTGDHGVYGKSITFNGTGVIGLGNAGYNYSILSSYGSGGAFSGDRCGVYGYASNSSGDRYGGYFAAGGGRYAYVGGRYSGTYRKIVGNGTVNTIVKNTKGELVTLTCPEAPESLFQDYGIGELVNGFAHITIDPDLALNINVDSTHPLKVFITLEGDCLGVYVTNKSANGFDVVELQGGTSSVPFSWQIVATRANEEYIREDGSVEVSDYSQRFQSAPGPLEMELSPGKEVKQKYVKEKVLRKNR